MIVRAVAAVAATPTTTAQTSESVIQRVTPNIVFLPLAPFVGRGRSETINFTLAVLPEGLENCARGLRRRYRSAPALERAPPAEDGRQRHEEDADVAKDREVLDVLALDGETLSELQ